MEDQRDRRVLFFALVIAAFEATLGADKHHVRHLHSGYSSLLAAGTGERQQNAKES
jgi:hypothetical protein